MKLENEKYSLDDALEGKGPFIRLTIEKTKVAPYWLNESIELYLPVDGIWHQLSDWPEIPCEAHNLDEPCAKLDAAQEDVIMSLPPDERKAMQFICGKKGGIKRKEIDEHCGWEEQKSMSVLNSLKDKGHVIFEGEAKCRVYKPKA